MMNCEHEWKSAVSSMNRVSTVNYWNRRAEDYNDFIQTTRFSYGEKIAMILLDAGFLQNDMRVLEIAGGVGALTLPVCRYVQAVTTIEPAEKMAENLHRNASEQGIDNVNVLVETCQDTANRPDLPVHDLAVMCHASWQFPDIRWLIEFMERIGNGRACLADSVPNSDSVKTAFYRELGISHISFNRFQALHNTLDVFSRNPEIEQFPFTMRRSSDSAKTMLTQVLGKYRQPNSSDIEVISAFVEEHSDDGIYQEEATMGVLWWHIKPHLPQ